MIYEDYTVIEDTPKYSILKGKHSALGILCKRCGVISWNPGDAMYKYCDKCKLFIETLENLLK